MKHELSKTHLIYEVNALGPAAHQEAYLELIRDHQRKLLSLQGFLASQAYQVEGENDDSRFHFVVHYKVQSRSDLEHYFETLGKTLRSEAQEKFQGQVKIQRRILLEI